MKRTINNNPQSCFAFSKAFSILLFVLVIFSNSNPIFADFDLQKYTRKSVVIATYPKYLINPPYEIERNKFTFINLKKCVLARLEFILGISPDLNSTRCYKTQKSIIQSIKAFQSRNNQDSIKYIDDNIIFNPESPLHRASFPNEKASLNCSYVSCHDLSKNGFIYCKHHGAEFGSRAYKRYQKQIDASNTDIRPDDIVDIAILLPLLLFPIITWFILMKVLRSTKKKRS